MKLKALALGVALAFPMMASAQSSTSVTLYGIVDTAVEYVNNIADGAGGTNSSFHFTNLTQSVPSRWGLRGTEDLGNGLKAVFTLESGFNAGTGQSGQGGRLYSRQAFVGLAGDWGQIAFGRQDNMLMRGMLGADIMGPNAYGLGSLDSYIPNTRMDNAITYMGNFSGVKFGAAYARGRDNSAAGGPGGANCGLEFADQSACQAYSFMLGYDAANWGVAGAYDVITGSDTQANFQALGKDDKDRRWTVNGYVKFDALKVSLLYLNRKNDVGINTQPYTGVVPPVGSRLGERSDLWSLAASYQVSPAVTLDGSVNYINYKDADTSSKAWYYVARATYSLSKRTAVYASASYIRNKGLSNLSAAGGTAGANPNAGDNQTAVMAGLRHSF
ncbi:porin [Pusillimonas noertemannii]|uniref:Putative porin n=1 Tax=Pusillimonas noertemannii TaxID=305977 RepID=A0A2U1CJR8_9BURK|nr:porin [Pusillimonas noertemannii]NYT69852.1 porin [Pusillimonas noertemannii]PVY61224.1 putative porin [Pusillimonas noertemannii]TFL09151.1 porin [Pusillimonas noertemannii]